MIIMGEYPKNKYENGRKKNQEVFFLSLLLLPISLLFLFCCSLLLSKNCEN